jgi:hypothetical protein
MIRGSNKEAWVKSVSLSFLFVFHRLSLSLFCHTLVKHWRCRKKRTSICLMCFGLCPAAVRYTVRVARYSRFQNVLIVWSYFKKKKNYNFQNNNQDNISKWATFTYIGIETRHITKIFKTTNLKIALEPNHRKYTYQNSGIYQHIKNVIKIYRPDRSHIQN